LCLDIFNNNPQSRSYLEDNPYVDNERIYILAEDEVRELPHAPAPEKDNLLPVYYALPEILSGRKVILPDLQ